MDPAYQSRVDEFLAKKRIAVAGYSREGDNMPANGIYDRLAANDYEVFAVNPHAHEIQEVPCYASLKDIQPKPDAVLICTSPSATMSVLEDCASLGIEYAWIHQSIDGGSYVEGADEFAEQNGIKLISFGCPMMFVAPDVFHKCFKWFFNLRGKFRLPELAETA